MILLDVRYYLAVLKNRCFYSGNGKFRVPSESCVKYIEKSVGVSLGYTDYYQGRGQAIRPTAALINIHEPLI